MKFIICLFIAAFMAMAHAQPGHLEELELQSLEFTLEDSPPVADAEASHRQKRATCDLLSLWNVNHTACAAHCLAKGFKGGYCNGKAVCVCRH